MATGAPEFQGALVRLADALGREAKKVTKALARLDQRDAMRYVSDAYPEIASPFLATAGDFAATWYEDQPTTADEAFYASPADLPDVEQLAANGRWALTQPDPGNALVGSSRRQMFNQARETILNNAEQEPGTRWVRHARAGACGFCRMLATRALTEGHGGAPGLYRTEETASQTPHRKFEVGHDFCRCIVVPLRPGAEYVPPDYLPQWLDDYYAVSRDADGRLLPPATIAARMEAVGRERQDAGDRMRRRPNEQLGPDVVDLDQSALTSARHLTERNAARADELVAPARDVVKQAKDVAVRTDQVVSKAATVAGVVKQVVDFADALLGDEYPALRVVKKLVDDTERALGSAATVTGKAATVTRVAERTVRDTAGIAHGAKQIVDDVQHLIDEVQGIAEDARRLADAGRRALDDRGGDGGLWERANRATERAIALHEEATALVDRARAGVESATNLVGAVGEIPTKVTAPIRDVRSLANHVQDVANAAQMAGADARVAANTIRQALDALDGRDRRRRDDDEQRAPIRVRSERLDQPAELEQEPLDVEVVELDDAEASDRQLAIERAPAQLALERAPAEIVTANDAPAVTTPTAGAIADWLAAEDEHFAALERIRAADAVAENLEQRPAETPDPIAAGVPLDVLEPDEAPAEIRTKGDQLRAALAEAKRLQAEPDTRKTAQGNSKAAAAKRSQRQFTRRKAVEDAQAALDAAIADGTADEPIAAPKPKRKTGRKPADVEAELRAAGDAAIQKAVDAFEAACATGDDEAIEYAATVMDAVERAEMDRRAKADEQLAKLAEKNERLRARRQAEREAERQAIFDEIAELVDDDATVEEYHQAEAEVVARRTGRAVQDVLVSIRKREFMRSAEVSGDGFEDTLRAVFRYEVHKAYQLAEAETNGVMVRRQYEGKFDPLQLWYCSDAQARKVMSEEMAAWFDANGRITLPVMRQMVLDGDDNFARRTVQNQDYLQ
jgi:hypothetical protein